MRRLGYALRTASMRSKPSARAAYLPSTSIPQSRRIEKGELVDEDIEAERIKAEQVEALQEKLFERTLLVTCGDEGPIVRGGEPGVRDEAEVRAIVRQLEHWYASDPDIVRRCLHPDAIERRFGSGRRPAIGALMGPTIRVRSTSDA